MHMTVPQLWGSEVLSPRNGTEWRKILSWRGLHNLVVRRKLAAGQPGDLLRIGGHALYGHRDFPGRGVFQAHGKVPIMDVHGWIGLNPDVSDDNVAFTGCVRDRDEVAVRSCRLDYLPSNGDRGTQEGGPMNRQLHSTPRLMEGASPGEQRQSRADEKCRERQLELLFRQAFGH
jgi:hypothetical protein